MAWWLWILVGMGLLVVELVSNGGLRQLVEERVDGCSRFRADELRHHAAVLERLHGGDPRDAVLASQALVRVDVNRGEHDIVDAAPESILDLFDDGEIEREPIEAAMRSERLVDRCVCGRA